jgi:hypothetical protein
MHPETITIADIDAEENAEVRRVMIEKYGVARYMRESKAREISRDAYGVLYRKDMADDEPIVMVRVLNSTPEADGPLTSAEASAIFGRELPANKRWKEYQIRVPPTVTSAHEAVAWCAGVSVADYHPEVET